VSLDEFMWAFCTVGARHLVFNNEEVTWTNDENHVYMILPLLDYINHSREPNVVALPYHDPINNSSQVVIQAIKDISAGDQLQMSYGKLANTHSI